MGHFRRCSKRRLRLTGSPGGRADRRRRESVGRIPPGMHRGFKSLRRQRRTNAATDHASLSLPVLWLWLAPEQVDPEPTRLPAGHQTRRELQGLRQGMVEDGEVQNFSLTPDEEPGMPGLSF
jgi:hypothetical protein